MSPVILLISIHLWEGGILRSHLLLQILQSYQSAWLTWHSNKPTFVKLFSSTLSRSTWIMNAKYHFSQGPSLFQISKLESPVSISIAHIWDKGSFRYCIQQNWDKISVHLVFFRLEFLKLVCVWVKSLTHTNLSHPWEYASPLKATSFAIFNPINIAFVLLVPGCRKQMYNNSRHCIAGQAAPTIGQRPLFAQTLLPFLFV